MGDDTIPFPPSSAEPARAGPNVLRLLEMALFAAVFIAGALLTWLAAFGDEDGGQTIAAPQPQLPGPVLSALTPLVPFPADTGAPVPVPDIPAFEEQVQFSNARGDTQPPVGCSAHIEWLWEIDRGLSPPVSGRALIEVTGGDVAGEYQRQVVGDEIRLSLDVQLSAHDVFTAEVISVGGVPAFPTPLEVSYDTPFC
jgi:hypothetical protein